MACRYLCCVKPLVDRELTQIRRLAQRIPDPTLKSRASFVLGEERWTIEGAALLSTLAPREHLQSAVRLAVGFQALYNYLDALGELPVAEPFQNCVQLHSALLDVLGEGVPSANYYRHIGGEDGGFLASIVARCAAALDALPSRAAILPTAREEAARCGEAQSNTHAAIYGGSESLSAWAEGQGPWPEYTWWEVVAGGVTSLSLQALFAAAADPLTTEADARDVLAAYFPAGALATLLDSVVDYAHDSATGNFSLVSRYQTNALAAERLGLLANRSCGALSGLRRGRRHTAILACLLGAYLSSPEAATPLAQTIARRVIAEQGTIGALGLALMRIRRRIGSGLPDAGARSSP
jgi:tetraprenyl-beta-curcumene synthase